MGSNLVGNLFSSSLKQDAGGNVTVDGDLTVTGTTTTVSTTNSVLTDKIIELGNGVTGSASGDAGIVIERGSDANVFIGWDESEDKFTVATGTFTGASTGDLSLTDAALKTGAITASGNISTTGDIILDDGGSIKEAGGLSAITISNAGEVTRIGQDTATNGQFLKYDGTKWVADAVATGSSAADDITAGDAAVNITTTAGDITIDAQGGDADIIFKGTDGSSDITALTLDMSEAGAASFNGAVTVGADITVTGGDAVLGAAGNTTATTISTVTNTGTTVGKSLTISAGSTTTNGNNLNGGDLILASGGGDGTGTSSIQFKTKVSGTDAAAERMRIHTDGNVGIGTNAPGNMLHIAGADAYLLLQNTTDENGEGEAETRVLFGDHSGAGLAMIEASHSGTANDTKGKFIVFTHNGTSLTPAITVDDTQATTFASTVTATGFTIGSAVISEAELEILDGASVTTTELNLLDGNTSVGGSITVADSDGFIVNDGGQMKTIPASDLKTYAGGGGTAADDSNLILHMQVFT